MARPSPASPLSYLVKRQYSDRLFINKQLLKERLNTARNLYRKDLLAHYGCVNAIEFSNKGELLASGGDDRRVLIWNVEQAVHGVCKPAAMRAQHISNIFCLGFDSTNSKIFSAGNDDQVIVHDAKTGDPLDYFLHEQPVYGLSIDPLNDNVFASACDDGRVLIFDIREPAGTDPFCLASYTSAFHAVMFNPVEPRILTTANSKEGVGLWDIRQPRQVVMRYGGHSPAQSCMSVRFNGRGTQILALRRRLPPILYSVHHSQHLSQFDHAGYYNSCTMKSCCFAGEDDQYVLSGSDDFNLYVWKIPDSDEKGQWVDSAHMILRGHRSIVNQVRFNSSNYIVASSGVEKLIKFWSPFPLPESVGGLESEAEPVDKQRRVFSHEEYISLVLRSGQFMSHDYSHQSTKEDPRMMAFFDSLVQREIEGWSSEDSYSSEISAVGIRTAVENALPAAASHSDSESSLAAGQVSDLQALAVAYVEALEGQVNNNSTTEQTNREAEPAQVSSSATSAITNTLSTNASTTISTGTISEAQNRISQLIARKRAQLMRFARTRQGQSEAADEGKHNKTANTDTAEAPRKINGKTSGRKSSNASNANPRKNCTRYMLEWIETSDDDNNFRTSARQKRKRLWEKQSNGSSSSSSSSSSSDDDSNTATTCKRQRRMRKHKGNKKSRRVAESDSSDSSSSNDSASSWQDSKNKKNVDNSSSNLILNTSSTSSSDGDGCHKKIALRRKRQLRQHKSSSKNTKVPTADNSAKKKNTNTEALDNNSSVQVSQNGKTNYIGLVYGSDSSTDVEGEVNKALEVATTPLGQKSRSLVETPDSGIMVAPCTSSTGSIESRPGSSGANHGSEYDPDYVFKRCKNRLDRARRNYRNRIGDSDSN